MPKLTTVTSEAPKSRRALAMEHLERLRARAAETDAKGDALAAELHALPDKLGEIALDAIVDETRKSTLVAMRQRAAALPGEITAAAAARAELDREIAEAEAAVAVALREEADASVDRLLASRERHAAEIDALLDRLADAWASYRDAATELNPLVGVLGAQPVGQYDSMALAAAARHADGALFKALQHQFAGRRSMVASCDSDRARDELANRRQAAA